MPIATNRRVSGSTTLAGSNGNNEVEILYNSAVQCFVRRDHIGTQTHLKKLLPLLEPRQTKQIWYEPPQKVVNGHARSHTSDEWMIKILKLVISSYASLYSDPPSDPSSLSLDLQPLLPPSSPDLILKHIFNLCQSTYFPVKYQQDSTQAPLLPPALISTLLLASLKLSPSSPALSFAHNLAEDWISQLPDSFILAISSSGRKELESAREGYLKVVELFVGEVLAREGEWGMARGFLEGESIMDSKRKENLYRHLRSMQSRPSSLPASPSSSIILPSPPSKASHNGTSHRSRSNSTSSSSSERTARPVTNGVVTRSISISNGLNGNSLDRKGGKGKGKAPENEVINGEKMETESTSSLPSRIYVNPPSKPSSNTTPKRVSTYIQSILNLLPPELSNIATSTWLATLAIPIPLLLLLTFMGIRRRLRRGAGTTVASAAATAAGGTVAVGDAMTMVRERLVRARRGGLLQWIRVWLGWWVRKFVGIWKLGTTITYV